MELAKKIYTYSCMLIINLADMFNIHTIDRRAANRRKSISNTPTKPKPLTKVWLGESAHKSLYLARCMGKAMREGEYGNGLGYYLECDENDVVGLVVELELAEQHYDRTVNRKAAHETIPVKWERRTDGLSPVYGEPGELLLMCDDDEALFLSRKFGCRLVTHHRKAKPPYTHSLRRDEPWTQSDHLLVEAWSMQHRERGRRER